MRSSASSCARQVLQRAAPEANYHDFAAVLGEAHVLAREAARDQVGRRLSEQLVPVRRGRRDAAQSERAASASAAKRACRAALVLTNKQAVTVGST